MTSELIVRTTLIAAAIVLIAIGVWHNDKMVAFEDWLVDRAAYITAMVIVSYRTVRRKFIVWLIHRQQILIRYLLAADETLTEKTRHKNSKGK